MKYVATLTPEQFEQLYDPDPAEEISSVEKLRRALVRATYAALVHAEDDDGGTCNFDSPKLNYAACGLSMAEAKLAIREAGLRCFEHQVFKKDPICLVICGFQMGQALRRTKMAETFCDNLRADGYPAYMYYQMD